MSTKPKSGQPILIVEDSNEDFETTVRALSRTSITNPIFRAEDGETALDFIFRRGRYAEPASAPTPGIILLDLNLPGTDGREVLQEIKADESLRRIPVIVLTTSSDERDIEACYAVGANSYVQKPVSLAGFLEAIERLSDYWLEISVLPKTDDELERLGISTSRSDQDAA